MNTITRDDAHAKGETFYFTGKPCKRGHIDRRYVGNGCCKSCLNGMYRRKMGSGISHDLISFRPDKLIVPLAATRDDLIRLRFYLQSCIWAYAKQSNPEWLTPGVMLAVNRHASSSPQIHNQEEIP